MLSFIMFLVVAAIYSWIFSIFAAIVEFVAIAPFFGRGTEGVAHSLETKPKLFFFSIIMKNVVLGLANSSLIFWFTSMFIEGNSVPKWIYVVSSFIWSLFIVARNEAFPLMFFMTSTVTLGLYWIGFWYVSCIITGVVTFVCSLAYYYGKIDYIRANALYGKFEKM